MTLEGTSNRNLLVRSGNRDGFGFFHLSLLYQMVSKPMVVWRQDIGVSSKLSIQICLQSLKMSCLMAIFDYVLEHVQIKKFIYFCLKFSKSIILEQHYC